MNLPRILTTLAIGAASILGVAGTAGAAEVTPFDRSESSDSFRDGDKGHKHGKNCDKSHGDRDRDRGRDAGWRDRGGKSTHHG